ncbi:MAG: hypothetical protein JSV86_06835 [Gemmatimonadota bacterium]|nr:MAG: hypothetical protein JSV86_06835 [Gemmatimonadota bacterium]
MMRKMTLALGLAYVALLACDDSTTPEDLPECTSQVTVSVSSGTAPRFSWTPVCRVGFVIVEENGSDVWLVISPESNEIAPPVTYGVVPPGATELEPPAALVAGTTYDVGLRRFIGDDYVELVGYQEFTP